MYTEHPCFIDGNGRTTETIILCIYMILTLYLGILDIVMLPCVLSTRTNTTLALLSFAARPPANWYLNLDYKNGGGYFTTRLNSEIYDIDGGETA